MESGSGVGDSVSLAGLGGIGGGPVLGEEAAGGADAELETALNGFGDETSAIDETPTAGFAETVSTDDDDDDADATLWARNGAAAAESLLLGSSRADKGTLGKEELTLVLRLEPRRLGECENERRSGFIFSAPSGPSSPVLSVPEPQPVPVAVVASLFRSKFSNSALAELNFARLSKTFRSGRVCEQPIRELRLASAE